MSKKQIPPVTAEFESLKQTNEHNAEYWRARDLQPLLGYAPWRRFEQAIDRAKAASCETSGNNPAKWSSVVRLRVSAVVTIQWQ